MKIVGNKIVNLNYARSSVEKKSFQDVRFERTIRKWNDKTGPHVLFAVTQVGPLNISRSITSSHQVQGKPICGI